MVKQPKITLKEEFNKHFLAPFLGGEELKQEIWNFFEPHLKLKKDPKSKIEIDEERIIEFNEIFPAIKGGSGKTLRSNLKELRKSFEWFFKNYDYEWSVIYQAAYRYIEDQEKENFKYCRTSKYTVVKFKTPNMPESTLSDYCTQVLAPEYFEGETKHSGFEPRVL